MRGSRGTVTHLAAIAPRRGTRMSITDALLIHRPPCLGGSQPTRRVLHPSTRLCRHARTLQQWRFFQVLYAADAPHSRQHAGRRLRQAPREEHGGGELDTQQKSRTRGKDGGKGHFDPSHGFPTALMCTAAARPSFRRSPHGPDVEILGTLHHLEGTG